MLVSKVQQSFNIKENSLNNNQTNFKALYFATPKVQEKCLKHPRFSSFINSSAIKEAVNKYNIVITDYFKSLLHGAGFNFRACTEVLFDKDKIVPAGMMSPVLKFDKTYEIKGFPKDNDDKAQIGLSSVGVKDTTVKFLARENLFNRLYFESDKEKESFQSNIYSHVFFDIKGIEDAIKRYNVIIHSGNPLKFSVASDVVQKGDKILPAGLSTRIFKIDSRNYLNDMHSDLGGYLDTVIKMTNQPVPSADDNDDSF